MTVVDFGSDCKISIDNNDLVSLADYYDNGVCRPIVFDHVFSCRNAGQSVFSSEAKIEIYREWKGYDRLVFTRFVRIIEGANDITISFYGVKNTKTHSGLFTKQGELTVLEKGNAYLTQ